jgi:hypothetical protein
MREPQLSPGFMRRGSTVRRLIAKIQELLDRYSEPPKLRETQVFVLRESARQLRELEGSTTQAEPQPLAQSGPTIQDPTEQSRPLAPLVSSTEAEVPPKIPKKRKVKARPGRSVSVNSEQGRAGGLVTVARSGEMDTRATRSHPSHT